MDITVFPSKLKGTVSIGSSKSYMHRILICAALADRPTRIRCTAPGDDVAHTLSCLRQLGADFRFHPDGVTVLPTTRIPGTARFHCGESGTTLRFMLPVAAALGINATFSMDGRLPDRPMMPLIEEIGRMGCTIEYPTRNTIHCIGQLKSGIFHLPADVSSQYISGLLIAGAIMNGETRIHLSEEPGSGAYIDITRSILSRFGISASCYSVIGGILHSPEFVKAEGDWSSGAFYHSANALGNEISVCGLSSPSLQPDSIIHTCLKKLENNCTIDSNSMPDLIPILSIVAAANQGAVFTGIQRLRLKESDRVASIVSMICALGGRASATEASMTVYGTGLVGGIVNSFQDHRIAMAAAIAATVCKNTVTILHADSVSKSYPNFWNDYSQLGGKYEQHLR